VTAPLLAVAGLVVVVLVLVTGGARASRRDDEGFGWPELVLTLVLLALAAGYGVLPALLSAVRSAIEQTGGAP